MNLQNIKKISWNKTLEILFFVLMSVQMSSAVTIDNTVHFVIGNINATITNSENSTFSEIIIGTDNISFYGSELKAFNITFLNYTTSLTYGVGIYNESQVFYSNSTQTGLINTIFNATVLNWTIAFPIRNSNTTKYYEIIQAAIDAPETLNGHTITVGNGTYYENIDITKSLTLLGIGNPEIHSVSPFWTVFVIASNSTVSGFTIFPDADYSAFDLEYVDNVVIQNNNVSGSFVGIGLLYTNNSIIRQNNLTSQTGQSIRISGSKDNIIENNYIHTTNKGIYLFGESAVYSQNNMIRNNIIQSSTIDGILLENYAVYNNIFGNTILNNTYGVRLVDSSSNSTLYNNNISYNNYGLYLDITLYNNITSNTINSNSYGIYMLDAQSNNITLNTISLNSIVGLISALSNYNIIYNNHFHNSAQVSVGGAANFNTWNITKTAGTNIAGLPYLGGNYYTNPTGTGYSETCTPDVWGFCNSPYVFDGNNSDYLPLAQFIISLNSTVTNVFVSNPKIFKCQTSDIQVGFDPAETYDSVSLIPTNKFMILTHGVLEPPVEYTMIPLGIINGTNWYEYSYGNDMSLVPGNKSLIVKTVSGLATGTAVTGAYQLVYSDECTGIGTNYTTQVSPGFGHYLTKVWTGESNLIELAILPWTDRMGAVFYLIVLFIITIAIYMKTQNVMQPLLIGLLGMVLFATSTSQVIPDSWRQPILYLFAIIIAGLFFLVYIRKD